MDDHLKEMEGKRIHDYCYSPSHVWLSGPLVVGAGPSGLAAAACLKQKGIDSLIIERENSIASLWKLKTYDRLHLHLPKQFCELPLFPFPSNFPKYPTKHQFIDYLNSYADHFGIKPVFNNTVMSAEFDYKGGLWKVRTVGVKMEEMTYYCQWLIVASGENAQEKVPDFEGMEEFGGLIVHTSSYKNGESLSGKRVLVVGCGNSGMEVCLDLCNFNACPSLAVRDSVHILPQEMLGRSTFGVSMWLLKWLPLWLVDQILLLSSRLLLGDTARFGLNRPKHGPLHLKTLSGKTPILDVGTLAQIKNGNIKVYPGIKRLKRLSVEFVDGRVECFDAIVLATGYRSNVTSWLKVEYFQENSKTFNEKDGFPRELFPNGWKGDRGLYAVGFSQRGLLGASLDAMRIAEEVEKSLDHLSPIMNSLVNIREFEEQKTKEKLLGKENFLFL